MKKLRIGFLSTAGIGRKNWPAVFNSGNCVVSAVASRDVKRSARFIRDGQRDFPFAVAPAALGSYEALLASENVDAVYIPLPTGLRKEWVVRAAQAGKHVVCEKPCAIDFSDLQEMISACRKNRVQFMDGVMFMHSPRMARVREVLDHRDSVGQIRRLMSEFSFSADEGFLRTNIRTDGTLEPAGCLGDLGWYCIRFALWAMNWQLPHRVTGKILSQSRAILRRPATPTEFSAELIFAGGVSAGFYCSFRAAPQQWVHVSGQKGYLRLPDFVRPFNSYEPVLEVNQTEVRVKVSGAKKEKNISNLMEQGHAAAQDTIMFRNFARQIFSGKLNDEWPLWSLKTQRVMDACLESARGGVAVTL